MSENESPNYNLIALDPNLLSTPFKIQTNWHVITGAPSSGKTTMINLIKDHGLKTVPEFARLYIEMEMAKGLSVQEVQKDLLALQRDIVDFHIKIVEKLPTNEVLFLDRGFPDCLSYHRLRGLDPNELLIYCFDHHYKSVFILDRLPFQQDGVRYEDDEMAEFHQSWLHKDYRALGHHPIRVPIISPEERLRFILKKLSEQE